MLIATFNGLSEWEEFGNYLIDVSKGVEVGYVYDAPFPPAVIGEAQYIITDDGSITPEEILEEVEEFIHDMSEHGYTMDEIEAIIGFIQQLADFHSGKGVWLSNEELY